MIIYHGSKQIIDSPIAGGSNIHNDYGPAFYLTTDLVAAKMWACRNDEIGVVNKYEIRNDVFNNLKILDLTDKKKYSVLNWIAILMHFRKLETGFIYTNQEALEFMKQYYIDVSQYDVVIGYRADDNYFRFPKQFIEGNLAVDDLEKIYLLGDLGIQYVFMSEKAVSSLNFIGVINCEKSFIGTYYQIVSEASKEFDQILMLPKVSSKKYIIDLIREANEK